MKHGVLCALALLVTGCGQSGPPAEPPPLETPYLRDATAEAGITFEHAQSRNRAVLYMPETLGPGTASFDFDGDGSQDLFFVQGSGHTDGQEPSTVPASHLYRNAGAVRFAEVAGPAGADIRGWGQSVVACDWNNDGYVDLVVTSYLEPVRLLTNRGDGTFEVARGTRGLPGGDRWWTSATALDRDRDGLLDLYLGAYVQYGPNDWNPNPPTIEFSGMALPQTMAPSPFPAAANAFLANRGDGTWADLTKDLDVADAAGRTLSAMAADLDRDGWMDLFVANDVSPCRLFHNENGKLPDVATRAFVDESRGSMGLALGDVDGDGALDIACSHWSGDLPAIYRHREGGKLVYQDVAAGAGLGLIPRDRVGWALSFRDLDGDGSDDLLIVNGHTSYTRQKGILDEQTPTVMMGRKGAPMQMLRIEPGSKGPLYDPIVGRSGAFTDVDNDGKPDVAVGVNNGRARLWHSRPNPGHWIGLEPVGTLSNRNAIGTLMDVASGAVTRHAQILSGDSFFSSSDARALISLGAESGAANVRVRWPSGRQESFQGLAVDRYHRLVEGTGQS